jgi:hypothetical protein
MARIISWEESPIGYSELCINWGRRCIRTGIRRKVQRDLSSLKKVFPLGQVLLWIGASALGAGIFGELVWAVGGVWGNLFFSGVGMGVFLGTLVGTLPGALAGRICALLIRDVFAFKNSGLNEAVFSLVLGGIAGGGLVYLIFLKPQSDLHFPALF